MAWNQTGIAPLLIILLLIAVMGTLGLTGVFDPLGLEEKLGLDKKEPTAPEIAEGISPTIQQEPFGSQQAKDSIIRANLQARLADPTQDRFYAVAKAANQFPWPDQLEASVTDASTHFVIRAYLLRNDTHKLLDVDTADWFRPERMQVVENRTLKPALKSDGEKAELCLESPTWDNSSILLSDQRGLENYFEVSIRDPEMDESQLGKLPYELTLRSKPEAFAKLFDGLPDKSLFTLQGTFLVDWGTWQNGVDQGRPINLKITLLKGLEKPAGRADLFAYDDQPAGNLPAGTRAHRVVSLYTSAYPSPAIQETINGSVSYPYEDGKTGMMPFEEDAALELSPVYIEEKPVKLAAKLVLEKGPVPAKKFSFLLKELPQRALKYKASLLLDGKAVPLQFFGSGSDCTENPVNWLVPLSYTVGYGTEKWRQAEEQVSPAELLLFNKLNQLRGARLGWVPHLATTAKAHSEGMAGQSKLFHSAPAENVAVFGPSAPSELSPEQVADRFMNQWIHSKAHYDNMMSPDYRGIGIGVAYNGLYYYATQQFN